MDYQALYNSTDNKETKDIIDAIAFKLMMDLPDPELWDLFTRLNAGSELDIVFLYDPGSINATFSTPAEFYDMITRVDAMDIQKEFLIIWDGIPFTVDRICDLECEWGIYYKDAAKKLLWEYIDPEDDDELIRLFNELIGSAPVVSLADLLSTAAKHYIESDYDFIPDWVKEWVVNGIVEYGRFTDTDWVASYLVSGEMKDDIGKMVAIWC